MLCLTITNKALSLASIIVQSREKIQCEGLSQDSTYKEKNEPEGGWEQWVAMTVSSQNPE